MWCHRKNKKLCWTGIPLFDVPLRSRANIDISNKMAQDVFDKNYLHSLDFYDIRVESGKKDKIPYTHIDAPVL